MQQFPKGPVTPEGQLSPGALVSRASSGGGAWPPAGDVLGFSGPITGDFGTTYAEAAGVDLLDSDWTFYFDVTCTLGVNNEILSQWASSDQSIRFRLGAGVNWQSLYGTTGTNLVNILTVNGAFTLNARTGLCRFQRVGGDVTLYDAEENVLGTANIGAASFFDASGPMILGASFVGTIHQAALTIDS